MITYYRWIPTLEVDSNRNVFKDVLSHEDNVDDKEEARIKVNQWLTNHYGYCIITINDFVIKLDNRQKMKKELKSLGFFIKV